jgi:hypothetical protein
VATSAKSAISSSPSARIHSTAIGAAFGVSAKISVASAAPHDGSPALRSGKQHLETPERGHQHERLQHDVRQPNNGAVEG